VAPAGAGPSLEAFVRGCLAGADGEQYAEAHRRLDRLLLPRVLEATGGNQLEAARRLGIARETLRRRLRELDLHLTRRCEADEADLS
jgi:two-component system nitrogen regulation response regulator GlnG